MKLKLQAGGWSCPNLHLALWWTADPFPTFLPVTITTALRRSGSSANEYILFVIQLLTSTHWISKHLYRVHDLVATVQRRYHTNLSGTQAMLGWLWLSRTAVTSIIIICILGFMHMDPGSAHGHSNKCCTSIILNKYYVESESVILWVSFLLYMALLVKWFSSGVTLSSFILCNHSVTGWCRANGG